MTAPDRRSYSHADGTVLAAGQMKGPGAAQGSCDRLANPPRDLCRSCENSRWRKDGAVAPDGQRKTRPLDTASPKGHGHRSQIPKSGGSPGQCFQDGGLEEEFLT